MKRKRESEEDERSVVVLIPPFKKRKLDSYVVLKKEDIPAHLMRYWYTRYYRFSKFDEGLWLNLDCLSESSYEEIAKHISRRFSESLGKYILTKNENGITVLDAMCGCGVSTIQFALNPKIKRVIAVDVCQEKLMFAKHNCEIYGVDVSKIEFVEDDIFNFLKNYAKRNEKIDACFLSPPWGGGVNYKDKEESTLSDVQFNSEGGEKAENGITLFNETVKNVTRNIAYSLPLSTSYKEFEKLNYSGVVEAETNYFNNKSKTKTFYFGDLVSK